jgi:predicted nucleic acid-binding protein
LSHWIAARNPVPPPAGASRPDDDFLLELAAASRADFIVTYNTRDFEGIQRFGIWTVTPAQFLKIIETEP